jgi:hypothetical protein
MYSLVSLRRVSNYLWEIYFVFKVRGCGDQNPQYLKCKCEFQGRIPVVRKGRVGRVDCQRSNCNEQNKMHMSRDLYT